MTISATDVSAAPGDVILVRNGWIEGPDGEVSPLAISFTRPGPGEHGMEGTVRFDCKHFTKESKSFGEDDLEVLTHLLWIGRLLLELYEDDGYSIWWREKGDLHFFDFWGGSRLPAEFSLPSAYNEASRKRFKSKNAGKLLLPSHRVGVEPDRPAITIYRVQKDGTDTFGSVIGPEELKGQTWEDVTELVGHRILWDSPEGVDLLMKLQPRREPDPED